MAEPLSLEHALARAAKALSVVYSPQALPPATRLPAAADFEAVAREVASGGEPVAAALAEALARPELRLAAGRLLASRGDVASLHALLAATRLPDVVASETAARALMQLEASPDVADVLVAELRARPAPRLRQPMLYALLSLADPDLVPRLEALWPELSAADRVLCLEGIAARGGPESLQLLRRAAREREAKVAVEAATGLCVRGQHEALERLLAGAAARAAPVRQQAVFGLGRVSAGEGVDGVLRALADAAPLVRMSALLSAVFLNEARLHPRIQALVTDPRPDVKHQALAVLPEVLGRSGSVAAEVPAGARLFRGRPARLEDYLELLPHPTFGVYAALQLSSATGEPTDFAPGKDLVYNLEAIERWTAVLGASASRRRAGAWYFHGRELAPPPSADRPAS
jgi:hypothetical protein